MTPFLLPTANAKPCLGEIDLQDVSAWLRLANASGLPPIALRALLAEFGGPQAVLNQSFGTLAAIAGEKAACAVLGPPPRSELGSFDECLARTLEWASAAGNTIVTLANSAYPPALLTMPDPPPLLYVKGRLDLLPGPGGCDRRQPERIRRKALTTLAASLKHFRRPAW